VKAMCSFFGVSRAAYYAWRGRIEQPDPDADRMAWVQGAYQASRRTYGYRRIAIWLRVKQQIMINPKAVLRLMNKLGIRSVARRRRIFKNVGENTHLYPNLLRQDF